MKTISILLLSAMSIFIFNLSAQQSCGTVTDIDGNEYRSVRIGNQCWMKENLKVTKYPSGTSIPELTDKTAWANLGDNGIDDAFCYYNNNANGEANTYGALYTWSAAMGDNVKSSNSNESIVQGICPDGWHLPREAEWTELTNFLGGDSIAGGKMKTIGTLHWNSPNEGADNSSGFSGIPGGCRSSYDGSFGDLGYTYFWSSTESDSTFAWMFILYSRYPALGKGNNYKSNGLSVRCLKD